MNGKVNLDKHSAGCSLEALLCLFVVQQAQDLSLGESSLSEQHMDNQREKAETADRKRGKQRMS